MPSERTPSIHATFAAAVGGGEGGGHPNALHAREKGLNTLNGRSRPGGTAYGDPRTSAEADRRANGHTGRSPTRSKSRKQKPNATPRGRPQRDRRGARRD